VLADGHSAAVKHLRVRSPEMAQVQEACLTVVTNACVLSTTHYLAEAIDAHRADGYERSDDVIAHLGPTRFESIKPYGAYTTDVAAVLNRPRPRPLSIPLSVDIAYEE
jgi:hypothetical protein